MHDYYLKFHLYLKFFFITLLLLVLSSSLMAQSRTHYLFGGQVLPGSGIGNVSEATVVIRRKIGDTIVGFHTVVTDNIGVYTVRLPCLVQGEKISKGVILANGSIYWWGIDFTYPPYDDPNNPYWYVCSSPYLDDGGPYMQFNQEIRFYGSIGLMKPQNAGVTCPGQSVGEPVNVTNGNMWLQQEDYTLPGIGDPISINRTYNSVVETSGLFGLGWSTNYDETIITANSDLIQLRLADGQGVYFGQMGNNVFAPVTRDFYGQIIKNIDGTYALTFKDSQIHKFDAAGRLSWKKDRNGNQTTLSYNASGQLIGITDAFNRSLTITPNANGTIQQISDSIGVVAAYEYFPSTVLLKTVTYQDGSKYKFEYDTTTVAGKIFLSTVKDALDNVLETHLYDSSGRATSSEKSGGVEKYTLDYTNADLQTNPYTTVTDARSKVTRYYFNKSKGRNVITKTEGNCGCGSGSETTIFEYDERLNLKKQIDALNRTTNYTYDANGNRLSMTDVFGTETYTYNSFGQILTATDRMNGVTTYSYDSQGNLETITDALSNVTTIVYPTTNNKGLPDSIKDAHQNVTKFKWFPTSGLLQEVENSYLKKTSYVYDAKGRIKTVTNALGHVTEYNYLDDSQRKVEMIYPNLDKITYKYDIRRVLESVTDERGKITTYQFDDTHRLQKITDPLGHAKEYGYDLMSNVTSFKDALGNITNYKYDDFDRLQEIEYPAAVAGATRLKEKFEYDLVGRIKKRFDTADRLTEYGYDDVNRTNTVTNANLETTTLKYNQRFQNVEVKDALNQIYTFTYDPYGRQLTQTRAGGTMTYVYDAVGNLEKRFDYMGRETNYVYDNLNRLKTIKHLSASTPPSVVSQANYDYDDVSRLISASNAAGTVSFTYDSRNRVESTTDVHGRLIEYAYDRTTVLNQKRLNLDGALYATYKFDDANRLSDIIAAADNTTISYGYDNADRLTSRSFPNNVQTTYDYDGMSRLKRLKDTNGTTTLFDRQYEYNSANQIWKIVEPSQTKTFGYDNANRLTSVLSGLTTIESYDYDGVGNRTFSHLSSEYYYDGFNRVSSTSTAIFSYDANGNVTDKWDDWSSRLWVYSWDYENRLTSVIADPGRRGDSVSYSYDALGRRVRRVFQPFDYPPNPTTFTYDGADVLLDEASSGTTKYLNAPGIDNKLRQTTNGQTSYYLSDHLGSTNALADSAGTISSQTSYDSFGNATNTNFASRYQFTGREYDSFSGLYYYRARWYDSRLGRFISEDPIGFAAGDVNLYGYVGNNPLNFIDPDGLQQTGPINYLRDPLPSDYWVVNGVSNTVSDLLSLDDIADLSWTLGNHCLSTEERIWSGAKLGGLTTLNIIGGGVVGKFAPKPIKWLINGEELTLGKNLRIAPFGNRTGHPIGKYPHYHRRGTSPNGTTPPGQGIGRHRPLETKSTDTSFWDRF